MSRTDLESAIPRRKHPTLLIALLFCAFGCCFPVYGTAGRTKDVELSIRAIESELARLAPLQIELSVESHKEVIRIYRHPQLGLAAACRPDDWLSLQILSPSGISLKKYRGALFAPKRPWKNDHVDVGPDSPYRETMRVFPYEYDTDATWPELGTYRLKAVYHYSHDKRWKYGRDLWEGRIESDWTTFKVVEEASKPANN